MSNPIKDLSVIAITDEATKRGFEVVKKCVLSEPLVNASFRLFEITFGAAGTYPVAHGFGYIPTDVLQSRVSAAATVTWNYDSFTRTDLSVTVSGACTVRAFIGRFEEET